MAAVFPVLILKLRELAEKCRHEEARRLAANEALVKDGLDGRLYAPGEHFEEAAAWTALGREWESILSLCGVFEVLDKVGWTLRDQPMTPHAKDCEVSQEDGDACTCVAMFFRRQKYEALVAWEEWIFKMGGK